MTVIDNDCAARLPARRGYRISDYCRAYSVSHETAYQLMRSGKLKYVMIGGRRMILAESAEVLLRTGDGSTHRRGAHLNQPAKPAPRKRCPAVRHRAEA